MAQGTDCGNVEKKEPFPTFPQSGDDSRDVYYYIRGCNVRPAKNCLASRNHLSFLQRKLKYCADRTKNKGKGATR
jgi:hypothetical protein